MQLHYALEGYWLSRRRDLSEHTVTDYSLTFRRFMALLGAERELESITSTDINRFLNQLQEKEISPKTVRNAWTALSSLWTWAEREHGMAHALRGKVLLPRYRRPQIEPFSEDEVRSLVKACTTMAAWDQAHGQHVPVERPTAARDRAILLVLLDCGLRVSELGDLTLADYDHKTGSLKVRHGKGDKARTVAIAQGARQAVWKYLRTRPGAAPDDPLFATRDGKHLDRFALRNLIVRLGSRAGVVNAYPHRFRHTFAINFLRNGANPLELQEILGHEDMETVRLYVRLAEVDIQKAQLKASPVDKWKL